MKPAPLYFTIIFSFPIVLFFLKFNIITAQKSTCEPFECNDTWDLFQDNDGKVYAYKAFVQESINFFEV